MGSDFETCIRYGIDIRKSEEINHEQKKNEELPTKKTNLVAFLK